MRLISQEIVTVVHCATMNVLEARINAKLRYGQSRRNKRGVIANEGCATRIKRCK